MGFGNLVLENLPRLAHRVARIQSVAVPAEGGGDFKSLPGAKGKATGRDENESVHGAFCPPRPSTRRPGRMIAGNAGPSVAVADRAYAQPLSFSEALQRRVATTLCMAS